MNIWHLTPDAPREPYRVSPNEPVTLVVGTWPVEPAQAVWIAYQIEPAAGGIIDAGRVNATWFRNKGNNSYWRVEFGPFARGDEVTYTVHGRAATGDVLGPTGTFRVGPKIYLAILWHQHQPIYKDTGRADQAGSYVQPWVRLHAIRDYYSMAALVSGHPNVHLTINLTPSLLWQIEDYTERGATDRALELTLKPAEALSGEEQEHILATFFEAHWHNQIFPHPRYKELFAWRREGRSFTVQDLRDLQMWYNLAWFGQEFRDGSVTLATEETVSVHRFVEQARHFSPADIEAMVAEQYKIMRAVIPIHRQLQDRGQIEIASTPFYHPILPLLVDTERATIDRPGTSHPRRFAHPEDAEAQVKLAIRYYKHCFGHRPRGMWPAEGALSQAVLPIFARHGVRWLITGRGVLTRSGRWGYRAEDPNVLCRPYCAEGEDDALSIFFRDTQLSDNIGFRYYGYADYEQAARDFVEEIKDRFVRRLRGAEDRVLTVILDGENAWGAFREDARPFLDAFYRRLASDVDVQTVTFAEYLDGNPARNVAPHPLEAQAKVHELYTGSWIDEAGSAPGADLGTWIGEGEENRAWELLGRARDVMDQVGAIPETAPDAFEALYMAEGSDWFWWFGADQDSGNDEEFDDLFRTHLKNIYRGLELQSPAELDRHIVPHAAVWTFTAPISRIQQGDRLTVRTNCPGVLTWREDGREPQTAELVAVGGVMAGIRRYHLTLGPFPERVQKVRFRFRCTHPDCDCRDICCLPEKYAVKIL